MITDGKKWHYLAVTKFSPLLRGITSINNGDFYCINCFHSSSFWWYHFFDMINNKKLNPVVTELFIRGRKLNISTAFISQSYFKVPKEVRLNTTHVFIMKIPKKKNFDKLQ